MGCVQCYQKKVKERKSRYTNQRIQKYKQSSKALMQYQKEHPLNQEKIDREKYLKKSRYSLEHIMTTFKPSDLSLIICSFLDLKSFLRVGKLSRLFYAVTGRQELITLYFRKDNPSLIQKRQPSGQDSFNPYSNQISPTNDPKLIFIDDIDISCEDNMIKYSPRGSQGSSAFFRY